MPLHTAKCDMFFRCLHTSRNIPASTGRSWFELGVLINLVSIQVEQLFPPSLGECCCCWFRMFLSWGNSSDVASTCCRQLHLLDLETCICVWLQPNVTSTSNIRVGLFHDGMLVWHTCAVCVFFVCFLHKHNHV